MIDERDPLNSYQPRIHQWPAHVQRGARFLKVDGHPRGYTVVISHFRVHPSKNKRFKDGEYVVCFGEADPSSEYHFAPWQFEEKMGQLLLLP